MPRVGSHFPPMMPPHQPVENFGSHPSVQLLLQGRPHRGEDNQLARFGLGPPAGNKLFLCGHGKQGVTPPSPRLPGHRLGGYLCAKLSLQPGNRRPADAQERGGCFQTGTEQSREQYGLCRSELMQVRGSGHELLGLSHQR